MKPELGNAITVSQLNNYIKQVFEAEEMLHNIEVVGDIDGIRVAGGCVYFTVKDEGACINCVCYYPDRMKGIESGSQVSVRGSISYWHKAGKISFVVNRCSAFGFGQLFLKFQQLQEQLKREGFFEAGKKKSLPQEVKRIGVVTSKSGAVIHDIIKVAHRRNPAVDVVLFPAAVQGESAARQIAEGIEFFGGNSMPVDVVIVARGGGSKEDLAAFNSECVARACFACSVPVVSAVGHETDWTLVDFVADLRAATPSAAAETVVAEAVGKRDIAVRLWKHVCSIVKGKLDVLNGRVRTSCMMMKGAVLARFNEFSARAETVSNFLSANNPMEVLKRGFTRTSPGFNELKEGEEFGITFYEGRVIANVVKKIKGEI